MHDMISFFFIKIFLFIFQHIISCNNDIKYIYIYTIILAVISKQYAKISSYQNIWFT